MFERITFNPSVMGGRACIRGMRITVALVATLAANSMSADEIIRAYPDLEPGDIRPELRVTAFSETYFRYRLPPPPPRIAPPPKPPRIAPPPIGPRVIAAPLPIVGPRPNPYRPYLPKP